MISWGKLTTEIEKKTIKTDIWSFFFFLFRAAHVAYGSSQARSQNGAAAAGLYLSHSNTGSEPRL